MAINIKNDETEQLVRELAVVTGESMTTAVTKAVEQRLERERRNSVDKDEKYQRMMAIVREMREIIGDEPLDQNALYDPETGLPV